MSLWSRTLLLFNIRASAALDRAEDPCEVLDYAYAQQREQLEALRAGLIEVATARRQLERHAERVSARVATADQQARSGLEANREDLARAALQRKRGALAELEALQKQISELAEDERKLRAAEQRTAADVDQFRNRRTVSTALYTAAAASMRAHEQMGGFAAEAADIRGAVIRAEERVEHLRARSAAVEWLAGASVDASPIDDPLERELRDLADEKAIERDLELLREEARAPRKSESEDAS